MTTLPLTMISGRRIFVNMDHVQHYSQRFMDKAEIEGTNLTFREPDTFIIVAESAEEIYAMWLDEGQYDQDSTNPPD